MAENLYTVLTEAINAVSNVGYVSPEQLGYWLARIRAAAEASLIPEHALREMLNAKLRAVYDKNVEAAGILQYHPTVSKFTLDRIKPQLHNELTKRVMASAHLIKLNRETAIDDTVRRFSGWASSVPTTGARNVDKVEEKTRIRKSLAQLPFTDRRVVIDQGHKLVSSINSVVALDAGAIAATWRSHWRQKGYDYRCRHKAIDEHVFPIRGNWAMEQGFMCKAGRPYTDEFEQPAELPFCRCYYVYLYNLRSLPDDMRTVKGNAKLAEVRAQLNA